MAIPVRARDLRALSKETRTLLEAAESAGWRLLRGRRHVTALPPSGRPVVLSSTPSDKRSLKNLRADLRRAGLDLK